MIIRMGVADAKLVKEALLFYIENYFGEEETPEEEDIERLIDVFSSDDSAELDIR